MSVSVSIRAYSAQTKTRCRAQIQSKPLTECDKVCLPSIHSQSDPAGTEDTDSKPGISWIMKIIQGLSALPPSHRATGIEVYPPRQFASASILNNNSCERATRLDSSPSIFRPSILSSLLSHSAPQLPHPSVTTLHPTPNKPNAIHGVQI